MTKEQILEYLRDNRHLVNMSGIAVEAKINKSVLANAINGGVDGHGTPHTLPDKYLKGLAATIDKLQVKK